MIVQPFLGDALELPEEVQLGLFAGVTPLGVDQPVSQVKEQRRGANVAEVFDCEVYAFADDAFVAGFARTNQVRREGEGRIAAELGHQPFFRQFDAVAFDTRKDDLQRVALRAHGLDLYRLARRLRLGDDRLGGEVEGNAEHVGVFDVEQAFFIEFVRLAAQRPTDDLLTQQLGAEGANAEHMSDGVGVPTFGEHGHGHDAADAAPELPRLAHGVHHLAQ